LVPLAASTPSEAIYEPSDTISPLAYKKTHHFEYSRILGVMWQEMGQRPNIYVHIYFMSQCKKIAKLFNGLKLSRI
jgi:hypothetical protein